MNEIVVQNNKLSFEAEQGFLQKLIEGKVLPGHIKTVETAFAIAQFGKELGIAPMQAFHQVIMINGKMTLSVHGYNALLRNKGIIIETLRDAEYMYIHKTSGIVHHCAISLHEDSDVFDKPKDRVTTIRFTRGTQVEEVSYYYSDAVKAQLHEKDNWVKYRREMMYSRCLTKGARRIGADIILGLPSADELFDSFNMKENQVKRDDNGNIIAAIVDTIYEEQ